MTNTFKIAISKAVTVVLIGLPTVFSLFAQTLPPVITSAVNGASWIGWSTGYVSPFTSMASNTWIAIFGKNLASSTREWGATDFVNGAPPTSLDGVSVSSTGFAIGCPNDECVQSGYIEYISPTQINVVFPADGMGPAQNIFYNDNLVVTTAQGVSFPYVTTRTEFNPGLFTVGNPAPTTQFEFGTAYYVAARHTDGVLVGKVGLIPGVVSRPAISGEIISIYGTGFGPDYGGTATGNLVSCQWLVVLAIEGYPVPGSGNCPTAVDFYTGNGNWTTAIAQWSGLVEWGLYQINVMIPTNLPNGDLLIDAGLGYCGRCNSSVSAQSTLITVEN